jgi:hypothetical protein
LYLIYSFKNDREMPKIQDAERDHRIDYEVIVDCYDDREVAMGWFIYMNDGLTFPIKATVQLPVRGGNKETIQVELVEVDPKSEDGYPIKIGIVEPNSKRVQYISPEHIKSINTTPENLEIINDWLYWNDYDLLA